MLVVVRVRDAPKTKKWKEVTPMEVAALIISTCSLILQYIQYRKEYPPTKGKHRKKQPLGFRKLQPS